MRGKGHCQPLEYNNCIFCIEYSLGVGPCSHGSRLQAIAMIFLNNSVNTSNGYRNIVLSIIWNLMWPCFPVMGKPLHSLFGTCLWLTWRTEFCRLKIYHINDVPRIRTMSAMLQRGWNSVYWAQRPTTLAFDPAVVC